MLCFSVLSDLLSGSVFQPAPRPGGRRQGEPAARPATGPGSAVAHLVHLLTGLGVQIRTVAVVVPDGPVVAPKEIGGGIDPGFYPDMDVGPGL
jgi:hypothetical protein